MSLITSPGGVGIAETVVTGDCVRAGNLRLDTFEDLTPRVVIVETPVGEALQVSTALGRSMCNDVLNRATQWILCRSVVTQKRNHIAGCRKSESQNLRIFGRIYKLVRSSLIIWSQERI